MPIVRSFFIKFSLRTGTIVSLISSLIFLTIFLIFGIINHTFITRSAERALQYHIIFLYILWFSSTMLAFVGVYKERSSFLIPELSRRVLLFILDIMGVTAQLYATDSHMVLPDVGLQWYVIISAYHETTYYVLLVVFCLLVPFKVYFFVVVLSYGLLIRSNEESVRPTPPPAAATTRATTRATTSSGDLS